jgi:FkbM family methyltransferase
MGQGLSDANAVTEGQNEPGVMTELFLRLIRLYTNHTPIKKGRYRTYLAALSLLKKRPHSLLTEVRDGRRFYVNLNTGMQETLFFVGEYERAITEIFSKLVNEGDVCVDAGANFGWYTTLMSMRAGPTGQVHSFEPLPNVFAELARNRTLAPFAEVISINNCALGDYDGTVTINLFADQPTGHASLARGARIGDAFECEMITLDSYYAKSDIVHVDIVKADIEGAEMLFLKGANKLFENKKKPIFLMEMALASTKEFGYKPNDLIVYIRERGDYLFYKVDELNSRLIEIDGFAENDIGANVFCIPVNTAEWVKETIDQYTR